MGRYRVQTLGCKANFYDSQLIEQELQKRGWSPSQEGDSEICIINSCTVTDEADKQTKRLAKKLSKENPQAKIIITGCGAEVNPDAFAKAPGVSFVVGNQNKDQIVDLILESVSKEENLTSDILNHSVLGTAKPYEELRSKHPMDREWPAISDSFHRPPTQLAGYSDKTRSFLKIQEGCNAFCTYCIIPYGRGPSRSLRPREIVQQVKELVAEGVREIVLTGTNIGDYGMDWGGVSALSELISLILSETSLERLRVGSLDPTEITEEMYQWIESEPRFCPHFHVSLQSPHSKILRLMKRKYSATEVNACLERISQARTLPGGVFVGMDVITGFPGEGEEEFQESYQALAKLPWSRLHVFPYSERSGTPATRLPHSVPPSVRADRTKKLNQLSLQRLTQTYRDLLKQVQSTQTPLHGVLLEKATSWDWVAGYTPNYFRVLVPKSESTGRNQMVSVMPYDLMVDSQGNDVALLAHVVESI